ncbi:MAG: asparagine synthase (glutamine-hydrolyzing) [bacterium]|nr:asparagine synthase (glutamine-hydrolyzing) [bacterium]
MCGIAGIILKQQGALSLHEKIGAMSSAIQHRGPDGEGFMLANKTNCTPYFNSLKTNYQNTHLAYIPTKELPHNSSDDILAFAHRRLAIIDLSETGHQPMCDSTGDLWITYNGEVYNFLELRAELQALGHQFISQSDTEVVLHAYREWGPACVNRFNGMWAFCIYDVKKAQCFASRDRFGVKPFYYFSSPSFFAFASEQKAFIHSGLVGAKASAASLANYLVNGAMEYEPENFFEGISELFPGHNLIYDLSTHSFKVSCFYKIEDSFSNENEALSEKDLIEKIRTVLEKSVKLRLRSDVEVGTCLSGGIDSSALAVTMAAQNKDPIYCFSSVFRDQLLNEERFADEVTQQIHARHFKVEPNLSGFIKEADALIYSQDVPIWSTSTYAQHKVMALAKEHGIKVVLDGQGADELFGGYHHHFLAKWNNLFSLGNYGAAMRDMNSSRKTIANPYLFYVKEKTKERYNLNRNRFSQFMQEDFLKKSDPKNPIVYFNDVNLQLADDITRTRLKAFLKCEDRCGMWHGVESRTPFSDDIDLIEMMFSFNGNKKIKHGISKFLLREAVKDKLPQTIYARYDKVGFETPMKQWMKAMRQQMNEEINSANFEFIKKGSLEKLNVDRNFDGQFLFKLFVFARWKKLFHA